MVATIVKAMSPSAAGDDEQAKDQAACRPRSERSCRRRAAKRGKRHPHPLHVFSRWRRRFVRWRMPPTDKQAAEQDAADHHQRRRQVRSELRTLSIVTPPALQSPRSHAKSSTAGIVAFSSYRPAPATKGLWGVNAFKGRPFGYDPRNTRGKRHDCTHRQLGCRCLAWRRRWRRDRRRRKPFQFAAIGDTGYSKKSEEEFSRMLAAMNKRAARLRRPCRGLRGRPATLYAQPDDGHGAVHRRELQERAGAIPAVGASLYPDAGRQRLDRLPHPQAAARSIRWSGSRSCGRCSTRRV